MSETFTSSFQIVRDLPVEEEAADEQRQYLNAPERLREAEDAEPCVERFVDYEFDPPEGKGAGRGKTRWPIAEPLAKSLSNQLEAMDEAEREWMRDTVTGSIAFGYVLLCWGQSMDDAIPPPAPGEPLLCMESSDTSPGGDPRIVERPARGRRRVSVPTMASRACRPFHRRLTNERMR